MEEQEKKKRIELEQEQNMSWKMYQILTITACIANLIGTICNFCIRYQAAGIPEFHPSCADDRDHRHYRMDYEKGANTGGLDHITTCMV